MSTVEDADRLNDLLAGIESLREFNILILGETGVGKSTFINALANYLSYATLKDALNEKLITVIPNEFTITDDNFESVVIRNGPGTNEEDFTAGHSATQKSKVHCFHFGSILMRLIDTPGVGDARGDTQDRKNFEDILNAVTSLQALHGIIILLDPNKARLTMTFRYCIEELLGRLHKSAADNIIFGFTGTRSTNFRPGDTMPVLLEHLKTTGVGIKCDRDQFYCFDSEGYRFMAAHSHGIKFEDHLFRSCSKSWDFTVREVARLITYIQKLTPHSIKDILLLNDTRMLIMKLGKPLAMLTTNIASNIDNLERDEKRIKSLDEDDVSLKDNLFITIEHLEAKQLDHPRTVCTNLDCVIITQNIECGRTNSSTAHHARTPEQVSSSTRNNSTLSKYSAMASEICEICTHSYREHIQITHELVATSNRLENEAVKDMMSHGATSGEVKAQMIEDIEDYILRLKDEGLQAVKTAASFDVFLAHNSITTCSDPVRDYFNFLISEEKKKSKAFRNENLLRSLETSIDSYDRELAHLNEALDKGEERRVLEASFIQESMDQLLRLPYSGSILDQFGGIVAKNPTEDLREVTYRLKTPMSDNLIFRALSSICTNEDSLVQSSTSERTSLLQAQHDLPSDAREENEEDGDQISIEEIATESPQAAVSAFTVAEESAETSLSPVPPLESKQGDSGQPSTQEEVTKKDEMTMSSASQQIRIPEEQSEQINVTAKHGEEKQDETEAPLSESPSQLDNEGLESYMRRCLSSMDEGLSEQDFIQRIIDGLKLEYQATTYGKEFTTIYKLISHLKKIEVEC